jgi:hypothetical protein
VPNTGGSRLGVEKPRHQPHWEAAEMAKKKKKKMKM